MSEEVKTLGEALPLLNYRLALPATSVLKHFPSSSFTVTVHVRLLALGWAVRS